VGMQDTDSVRSQNVEAVTWGVETMRRGIDE